MPCISGSNEEEILTELLCSTCRVLKRMNYDFDENPQLSHWWQKHQKIDELKKTKKENPC